MTKLRKILVALLLVLGVVGVAVSQDITPASAYLTQCSAGAGGKDSWAQSFCTSHVNNGGLNQQRVYFQCGRGAPNAYYAFYAGQWANENQWSQRRCTGIYLPNGYLADGYIYSVSYQLR